MAAPCSAGWAAGTAARISPPIADEPSAGAPVAPAEQATTTTTLAEPLHGGATRDVDGSLRQVREAIELTTVIAPFDAAVPDVYGQLRGSDRRKGRCSDEPGLWSVSIASARAIHGHDGKSAISVSSRLSVEKRALGRLSAALVRGRDASPRGRTRMIVIDASALALALADDGAEGDQARARLTGERLAAPELIMLEVAWSSPAPSVPPSFRHGAPNRHFTTSGRCRYAKLGTAGCWAGSRSYEATRLCTTPPTWRSPS